MRWQVEVSTVGKDGFEPYTVEADSWQRALQAARKIRGDESPMSGFSIELMNEGCRAVDPAARIRYDVKRTADDAPVTPGGEAAPKSAKKAPAPRPSSKEVAAKPVEAKPAETKPAETKPVEAKPAEARPAEVPKAPPSSAETVPALPPAPESTGQMPGVGRTPAEPWPAAHITFKREVEPTEAVPLTYREYAFVIAKGTSEDAAAQALLVQFLRIRKALEDHKGGKLVNLGAFDEPFADRPAQPPIAALVWKDWKGEPVVSFPRRDRKPAAAHTNGPAAVAAPAAPIAITATAPAADTAKTVEIVTPQTFPEPPPSKPAVPVAAPVVAPVVVAPVVVAPVVVAAPAAVAPAPVVAPVIAAPIAAAIPQPTPSRPRGDELIADLFEAVHDLHFQSDAIDGARFVLDLAQQKIPSRAAMVHFYDIDKREFVIVAVAGAATQNLLLRRAPEAEPLLAAAMRKRQPLVTAGQDSRVTASVRYALLGDVATVCSAPVLHGGRFLGIIEMIDPLDGSYDPHDVNALAYIAEQFAEFLSQRGVVLDPERIKPAQ